MNTQHSPAPWRIETHTENPRHFFKIESGGRVICDAFATTDEDKANAHLISAAPELLHALKEALANLEYLGLRDNKLPGMMQRINYAIAKAEGRQ